MLPNLFLNNDSEAFSSATLHSFRHPLRCVGNAECRVHVRIYFALLASSSVDQMCWRITPRLWTWSVQGFELRHGAETRPRYNGNFSRDATFRTVETYQNGLCYGNCSMLSETRYLVGRLIWKVLKLALQKQIWRFCINAYAQRETTTVNGTSCLPNIVFGVCYQYMRSAILVKVNVSDTAPGISATPAMHTWFSNGRQISFVKIFGYGFIH